MISKRLPQTLLGLALLPLAALAAPGPHPDPSLDAAEVVRIQLKALAHNDTPRADAGLEVAYAFASPENRRHTGPLRHFTAMVHNTFAPLLNHRSAHLNPIVMQGEYALEPVDLVGHNGLSAHFVFVLSRQTEAPFAGCWMTDGVLIPPGSEDQTDADQQDI